MTRAGTLWWWISILTEESANNSLENEHSPQRGKIKVRKNEMKLRKIRQGCPHSRTDLNDWRLSSMGFHRGVPLSAKAPYDGWENRNVTCATIHIKSIRTFPPIHHWERGDSMTAEIQMPQQHIAIISHSGLHEPWRELCTWGRISFFRVPTTIIRPPPIASIL